MNTAKLCKVYCIGNPTRVKEVSSEDWMSWVHFVREIVLQDFDQVISMTYWRETGDPFQDPPQHSESQSLYGIAYQVLDDEGNILSASSGYHIGELKDPALQAEIAGAVEDWSLELREGMLPIARLVGKLHQRIADMKKSVTNSM